MNELVPLNEATLRDLQRGASAPIVRRATDQKLVTTYLGVDKKGIIQYKTTSGTYAGKFWYQQIKLRDIQAAMQAASADASMRHRDIVNLAVFGDIEVHCNDPSYLYYGWQYIGTQLGYALFPERRFPRIRNPGLQGTVCKHLFNVLQVLPFHITRIVRDMKRQRLL